MVGIDNIAKRRGEVLRLYGAKRSHWDDCTVEASITAAMEQIVCAEYESPMDASSLVEAPDVIGRSGQGLGALLLPNLPARRSVTHLSRLKISETQHTTTVVGVSVAHYLRLPVGPLQLSVDDSSAPLAINLRSTRNN